MEIDFKENEDLNNRKSVFIDEWRDGREAQSPEEIEIKQIIEDSILDIQKHLSGEQAKNEIDNDLKRINQSIFLLSTPEDENDRRDGEKENVRRDSEKKSIRSKLNFLHLLFSSYQFPKIIFDLLAQTKNENGDDESYFKKMSLVLKCIANLLCFSDFQSYFIENDIIENAMVLISHESSKVSKESLHIISELMPHIIKTELPIPELFIYHIISNINDIKAKQTLYAVKIFYCIAKYSEYKQILKDAIRTILNIFIEISARTCLPIILFKKESDDFQSDFDGKYETKFDPIQKYIIQTIYYILKSDFSFYYSYQTFFHYLFYIVNGFSTTTTDKYYVTYVFKILLLISYNDEKEATILSQYIGYLNAYLSHFINERKQKDWLDLLETWKSTRRDYDESQVNYEFYYYFLQNSDFIIKEQVVNLIIFNLFHLSDNFYKFSEERLSDFLLDQFPECDPYHMKNSILRFFQVMVQHQNPQEIIQMLINKDFIQGSSAIFDGDELDSILNLLIIIDKMIEYAVVNPFIEEDGVKVQDNISDIVGNITNNIGIMNGIDRLLDELPEEIKNLESCKNPESVSNELQQRQKIFELCQKIKGFIEEKIKEAEEE